MTRGETLSGTAPCHVCGSDDLVVVSGFEHLHRVTSDCKLWPTGGRLGACGRCGVIQKAFHPEWAQEAAAIYRDYTIYHQARNSTEQAVFDGQTGHASTRSSRLVDRLMHHGFLASRGRLLDVGCGNGAFLKAASQHLPAWRLAGAEIDDKYKQVVEGIPGVEGLYACAPAQIPGTFDVITMIHAIEHIADPVAFLRSLAPGLGDSGVLVIDVPNVAQNPFDLLVADHASHFTLASLCQTLEAAGYSVLAGEERWVPKELTVVARPAPVAAPSWRADSGIEFANRRVQWLHDTVSLAQGIGRKVGPSRFGLFGTSIAGTWLGGELAPHLGFFVDEDASRVGQRFMDRPVYAPDQVAEGSHVFVGLAPTVARPVADRLRNRNAGVTAHEPPVLD